jgi:hypothetical protein
MEQIKNSVRKSLLGKYVKTKILKCNNCKKLKKVYPSEQIKYKRHFCSHKCLTTWVKKNKKSIFNYGKKHHNWKGDNVGYPGIHAWVKRRLKKPKLCEKCYKKPPYDLANKSGKYLRNLSDWEWLCRKCHMVGDGRLKNLHKKRVKMFQK